MSQYSSKWIKVSEPYPHVLHVELSRPPVNAFNIEYWKAYGALFEKLVEDGYDVRALVLSSSNPKIFTGGLDLSDAANIGNEGTSSRDVDSARSSLQMRTLIRNFQNAITSPENCPFPVISALHGPVIGLGVDIIVACDIRYASSSPSTYFAIKEVDIGLAADIGSLAYLPKITGNQGLVRELAYTARNFSVDEAVRVGLVTRVVDGGREEVVKEALELAKLIASKSPIAVSGSKVLINHARDHTVKENLEYTQSWNAHALMTNDIKENVIAIKTRQIPKFAALKVSSKL